MKHHHIDTLTGISVIENNNRDISKAIKIVEHPSS